MEVAIGDIVLIMGNDKHRGKWNIGIVEELYQGKDNIIRAVKFQSKKTYIEQPVQFLYPHELSWCLEETKKLFINTTSNH